MLLEINIWKLNSMCLYEVINTSLCAYFSSNLWHVSNSTIICHTDTPHHAAVWQKSCLCFSSTPWSTAPKTPGTSTMTVSFCPRWEPLSPTGLNRRPSFHFYESLNAMQNLTFSLYYCGAFFLFSRWICDWDFFYLQGHAAPALYSMWVETGFLKDSELLSLCQVDSVLEGHLSPVSCHILYHTSRVVSCSTSSVPTDLTNILLFVFVVCNSEAATYWCNHWILGAGSWCGLWHGLYWEILWQVQVILHTCGQTQVVWHF